MADKVDVLAVTEYLVTYRDTYGASHTFTVRASDLDEARDLANGWKGSAPVAIVSVREVPEFPRGAFPPQANIGALA